MTAPSEPLPAGPALTAFREGAGAAWISRDVLDVVGPDAVEYLQGQLSQDVAGLAPGGSGYTLLLQPQGKIDAWGRLSRLGPEHVMFDLDAGHGEAALARLQRFKLRVECELSLRTVPTLAVRGPAAADGAGAVGLVPGADAVVVSTVPAGPIGPGFDVLGPVDDLGSVVLGPAEALEALRVASGIPAMGRELDTSTIPAAAGIVEMSVDFDKGCYVGQELVARIDSRGANTPTRLRRVLVTRPDDGRGPGPGATVVVDGADVGALTSVTPDSIPYPDGSDGSEAERRPALAYVRRVVEPPVEAVVRDGDGTEWSARIESLEPAIS